MDFRTFLQQNIAVFDGAFGTMVQKSGARVGTVPEEINLTQPQLRSSPPTSTAPTRRRGRT